ncbi:MAG TPA: right-handed parallel beta-helix repeat-containing protein [Polyangiaceae bacterium]|nr:right-handed parallel beta-helix repeat-containing protein [Polyangiaceae bacterium]
MLSVQRRSGGVWRLPGSRRGGVTTLVVCLGAIPLGAAGCGSDETEAHPAAGGTAAGGGATAATGGTRVTTNQGGAGNAGQVTSPGSGGASEGTAQGGTAGASGAASGGTAFVGDGGTSGLGGAGSTGTDQGGTGGVIRKCGDAPLGAVESRIRYVVEQARTAQECAPESQYRSCRETGWSEWSGSNRFPECTVEGCPGTLETRVRFAQPAADYPASCVPEVQFRPCESGVFGAWSGTFEYETCVNRVRDCGAVPHGGSETRTRYQEAEVPFDGKCASEEQQRVCVNGAFLPWSGSFGSESCRVLQAADCDGKAHGTVQQRVRYAEPKVNNVSECKSEPQTRTCTDGTWSSWSGSGDASHEACLVRLQGRCTTTRDCQYGVCSSGYCVCQHRSAASCSGEACCGACAPPWTGDNCDQCPASWDKTCSVCSNHWRGRNCDDCPSQFTVESNCTACSPGWSGPNCETQAVCVRFVDPSNTASFQTGYSWREAYANLSTALNDASRYPSCELWLRAGTYSGTYSPSGEVSLYGGFDGHETSRSERDPEKNPAIFSGGIVPSSTVGAGLIIDGITVSGRYIELYNTVLTMRNSKFETGTNVRIEKSKFTLQNSSLFQARNAIFAYAGSQISIQNSRFVQSWGPEGAALSLRTGSRARVEDSLFLDGIVGVANSEPGGVMYVSESGLEVSNCVIANNTNRSGSGGAIVVENGEAQIVNATIVNNSVLRPVDSGGAFVVSSDSNVEVVNSILWGNVAPKENVADGPIVIRSSIVEGGFPGDHNMQLAPWFRAPDARDYRLSASSPGIDAADGDSAPERDLNGQVRVDASVADQGTGTPTYADVGAYEWH